MIDICSGWYMATTVNIAPKYDKTLGFIESITSWSIHKKRLDRGVPWCLDNGVFSGKFEVNKWLSMINTLDQSYHDTCLFIVVPDKVGDAAITLSQFKQYRDMIPNLPAALVSQDGIAQHANKIPWDDFDVLFVGGTDKHKLGPEGTWIGKEAQRRGKWVHIGRVNSVSRILKFWWANSWDGTCMNFNLVMDRRFHAAVLQVRNMQKTMENTKPWF